MTLPRGTLDWKTAGKKAERIEKIPDMCFLYPQQHCLEKKALLVETMVLILLLNTESFIPNTSCELKASWFRAIRKDHTLFVPDLQRLTPVPETPTESKKKTSEVGLKRGREPVHTKPTQSYETDIVSYHVAILP